MSESVVRGNSVVESAENGKNSEDARMGMPSGFMNKVAVLEGAEKGDQVVSGQEFALVIAEKGGVQKPPAPNPVLDGELVPGLPRPVLKCRGGRPTVMTPAMKEQLCMLLSLGLSRRQAAAYLDIAPSTIANLAERDPDFACALERAEDLKVAEALVFVAAESRRNWRAAAWLIEHAPKIRTPKTPQEREAGQAVRLERIKHKSQCRVLEETLAEQREDARQERARARHIAELARQDARERELQAKEKAEREARRAKRLAEGARRGE